MIMTAKCCAIVAMFVVAAIGAGTRSAWAQAPTPPQTPGQKQEPRRPSIFRSEVSVGFISDDNLFFQPVGSSDLVLRVTPLVELRHSTPRFLWSTRYRLDAERFSDHPNLTTPLARQDAGIEITVRPNSRSSVIARGGYERTHTAGELNLTTGLTSLRMLASRWQASGEITHAVGARAVLLAGYDVAMNMLEQGTDTESQSARLRFTRRTGARDEIFVAYLGERLDFGPGGLTYSNVGSVGWLRRVTPTTVVTLNGGARLTAGDLRPDLDASVTQRVGTRISFFASYARTQTVAVGIAQLIDVDRVTIRTTYRVPNRWEAAFTAGAFRNVFPGAEINAYTLAADISRVVSRSVAVAASFSTTLNQRAVSSPIALDEQIRRQAIGLALRFAPWSPR